jgi:hypothetical protein
MRITAETGAGPEVSQPASIERGHLLAVAVGRPPKEN